MTLCASSAERLRGVFTVHLSVRLSVRPIDRQPVSSSDVQLVCHRSGAGAARGPRHMQRSEVGPLIPPLNYNFASMLSSSSTEPNLAAREWRVACE